MLGAKLRELRTELGVSCYDLAEDAGYSKNTVGVFERGERAVGVDKVEDFFQALGYKLVPILITEEDCDDV